MSQHKSLSSWYDQISRVTIENFENREQALEAETKAILNEKPKYNVQKSNVVEKIKENKSDKLARYVKEARENITNNTVYFDAIYKLEELERHLKIGPSKIKKLIDSGHLKAIVHERQGMGKYKSMTIKKYYVTGWQLIDFIENCQMTGIIP